MTGDPYWDKRTVFYGALRPKEDFIKPEFRIEDKEVNTPNEPQQPLGINRSAIGKLLEVNAVKSEAEEDSAPSLKSGNDFEM